MTSKVKYTQEFQMAKRICTLLLLILCVFTFSRFAQSRPYHGEIFTFYQPDGQPFQIQLTGDEYYAVIETLDGYTLIKDITTGFYCYATTAADGMSFISTGVKAGGPLPASLTLKKQIRLSRDGVNQKSMAAREKFGVDSKGRLLPAQQLRLRPQDFGYERWTPALEDEAQDLESSLTAIQPGPPSSITTGTRVGLVLLAQFPDRLDDATISQAQVDAYANDPDYNDFGNATSVYGYYNIQSNGMLQYNCTVTAYFTAAQNRDYYTDNAIAYGTRAKELINEGLQVLKDQGFDFTKTDADSNGVLDGVNIFYAGSRVNGWSEGLWPHKWSSSWAGLSGEGVSTSFQYQITDMGTSLTLGTFCHENGHMICAFPDLYSYNSNAAEINAYSLMSQSGTTHPRHIDAYLKIHAGWATVVDITSASHLRGTVKVDQNTFYRFRNPSESREYFLLSIRADSGYEGVYNGAAATNPTDGLVIWHAREHGSNTYSTIFTADSPAADYTTPYELMVVEANPSSSTTPWYDDPYPGSNDAYHSGDLSEASDSTSPALKFWNTSTGRTTSSNMHIHSISSQGDAITFTIGSGAITGSPIIGITSSSLNPSCNYGVDAMSQTFSIFNQGAGTLSYTISDSSTWLSLDISSGTATTEADLITVSYDTDSLASGTYVGTITITDSGATNSPQTLTVTLTVQEQSVMALSSATMSQALETGDQGTSSFTLSNSGGGTLSYTLSESADWLELSATSGSVASEEDEIVLSFDATHLFAGTYTTTITVNASNAANAPLTINVSLTVTGSIVLVNPNGGETLWQGNNYDLKWLTDGNISGNVQIDLYKGGILDRAIVASTDNDGLFQCSIPADQAIGSDYTVRITSVDDTELYGESSASFVIAAMPTLISIPYSESFESGFGDWSQATDDDFDWIQNSASTPSSATGPTTAQDGTYYIYTEASSPNFPSKTATLQISFDLRSATAPIMSFHYHMYGSAMGELTIRASSDQQNWTTLFNKSGDQGNSWMAVNADLSSFAGKAIMIQIIGTTGSSYTSDMALDGLTISEANKTLSYDTETFNESSSDDGSITNTIVITLAGDTFTSTVVSGGHVTASNAPDGLTASFVRDSATQLSMSLIGNAVNHDQEDSIQNLEVQMANGAFTGEDGASVAGNIKNVIVNFIGIHDADGDGVPDIIDQCNGDDATGDTDTDGTCNDLDTDDDNDGLPDVWENLYNLDPLDSSDAAGDSDGDGYTNLQEYIAGSSPTDPNDMPEFAPYDLTGDGTGDILIRHNTYGTLYMIKMDGATSVVKSVTGLDNTDWRVVAIGDLSGDGTNADILIRHESFGTLYMITMDSSSTTPVIESVIGLDKTDWQVSGIGDLSGDGTGDILIRHENFGALYMIKMDGVTPAIEAVSGLDKITWEVVGIGDLSGDGTADILIRHNTYGTLFMIKMDDTTPVVESVTGLDKTTWAIVGVADLSGDGIADILIRHTTYGVLFMIKMDSGSPVFEVVSGLDKTTWNIVEIADLSGDGTADILIRHTTYGVLFMIKMDSGIPAVEAVSGLDKTIWAVMP